jgi:serine/threonine protein kinase
MTVAATDAALESFGRFGRYTLLRPIASGGMAEVHLASFRGAAGVETLVAIKRILLEHARDPEFVAMFLNEARIAATLHHANVVQAYDFGCEDGRYFLAMEYLRGQDARRIVQELAQGGRRIPLAIATAIGIGAAAGLHYLHEKRDAAGQPLGLVHRDVSPANIFLTEDGIVKLVDFGIAKAVRGTGETRAGTLKGKVSYLSPEQCRSERLDRRSDVFSLAIVLWELTVGRRLFDGGSDLTTLNAIDRCDPPRPSRLVPRYPRELERILVKGLARDRDRRYQTAAEMQDDLEAFARAHRLAVAQGSVSSFVRTLSGARDHLTVAAVEPENDLTPPAARAPSDGRGGPRGRTRVLRPSPWSAPALVWPPRRHRAPLAALGLLALAAIGGLPALWFAHRRAPTGAAPPIAASLAKARPPRETGSAAPLIHPVVSAAAPPSSPADPPGAPAPAPRKKHDRARRIHLPLAPDDAQLDARQTAKWSPDSALPPP